jgi:fermentation-respiration switch protein FrsA (DUF1100 family)
VQWRIVETADDRQVRRYIPWHRIRRVLITVAATYIAVCVLLFLFQSHLIYFPTRGEYDTTPADIGLEYEDLILGTADGRSIAAWYVGRAGAKGSVIFCHGNAGNMADRLYDIKLLTSQGYNVLIFDYAGYGRSEGRPTERATYEDAEAVWRYLVEVRGESPQRVVLFGRSLGGAVAIELAQRHAPAALVVESTFTRLADVGQTHYPLLPVRLLLRHDYDSISKVPGLLCPKLFLHGTDDELIPIDQARRLFLRASPPKEFIETPGGHITGGFTYDAAHMSRFTDFVDAALRSAGR